MNYIKTQDEYIALYEEFLSLGNDSINESFVSDIKSEVLDIMEKIRIHLKSKPSRKNAKTFLIKVLKQTVKFNYSTRMFILRFFLVSLAIILQTNTPLNNLEIAEIKKEAMLDKVDDVSTTSRETTFDDVISDMKENLPKSKSYYHTTDDFIKDKSLTGLLKLKIHHESRGNWKVINEFGFMGLYQMGERELKGVGFGHVTVQKFREDPNIFPPQDQHTAYMRLLSLNKYLLRNFLKYVGTTRGGVYLTEGSIIGASTIGVGYVKKFIQSDGKVDPKDGYGISTSFLLKEFQSYDVSEIKMMTFKEWITLKYGPEGKPKNN